MSNLPAWMTGNDGGGPSAAAKPAMPKQVEPQQRPPQQYQPPQQPQQHAPRPQLVGMNGPPPVGSFPGMMPPFGMPPRGMPLPPMVGGMPPGYNAGFPAAMGAPMAAGGFPPPSAAAGAPGSSTGAAAAAAATATAAATGSVAAATAGAASLAPAAAKDFWREYKDASGRTYYHDQRTNKTTYEKPECLKTVAERTLAPCKWKEYTTPDGRKYFSDGVNSVWVEPPELTQYKAQAAALNGDSPAASQSSAPSATADSAAAAAPPSAQNLAVAASATGVGAAVVSSGVAASVSGADSAVNQTSKSAGGGGGGGRKRGLGAAAAPLVFNSQEERVSAFIEMLRDMEISSNHKWADVQRLCSEDPRWAALRTTGQKKQNFSEFQTKRLKEEKEERRSRQRKAKDNFFVLLAEDTTIDAKTRWREAQQRLSSDDRYTAVEDDRDREDLFNEWVMELGRKDEEERREARRSREEGFSALLKELSNITHKSRWLDVRPELESKRDRRFEDIDENDRRHIFQDYVTELRKVAEVQMREKEKERRAEEKSRRDAFLASLREKAQDGTITAASTWRDCKLDLEKEPTYIALEGQPPSTGRQLFDEVVEALERAFKDDRKVRREITLHVAFLANLSSIPHFISCAAPAQYMRGLLTDSETPMTHETSYVEFGDMLAKTEEETQGKGAHRLADIRKTAEGHMRLFYDEALAKEVSYHEEKMRRKKHREDKYLDLLEEYYYRSDHIGIPWKEAEYDMENRTAFRDMPEVDRRRMYDDHMATLQLKLGKRVRIHLCTLSFFASTNSPSVSLLCLVEGVERRCQ